MIYNDVLTQLQLLIKTSAPPLLEVATGPVEEPEWVPGQRVTAFVLAAQPNGRFQVRIGDHVLDMNLPRNTQPGDNAELTFVSNQPRLTFILSRDLAAAAQQNPQSATSGNKAPVTISDTARFLGALLQKISEGPQEDRAAPLTRAAPLVATPPADVKEFASVLRGALTQSGLFYESHQAQWVTGQRPLADLLREPQGKLSQAAQPMAAGSPEKPPHLMEPGQTKATMTEMPVEPEQSKKPMPQPSGPDSLHESQTKLLQSAQAVSASPVEVQHAKQGAAPSLPATPISLGASPGHPVHPDTMPLVQQQLHALDARQLVWQGEVWQGQTMEWTVEERLAREHGEQDASMWQTSLRLKLPRLGDVVATLAFIPQGLRISLKVAETDTGQAMQLAQGQLRQGLEAAGLSMLGMTVEQHETAGKL